MLLPGIFAREARLRAEVRRDSWLNLFQAYHDRHVIRDGENAGRRGEQMHPVQYAPTRTSLLCSWQLMLSPDRWSLNSSWRISDFVLC
jgi:hypothetical protein